MHPGLFEAENNVNRLFGSLVNSHHRSVARVSFLNIVDSLLGVGTSTSLPHVWHFSACQDMVKESTVERTGVSRTRPDPVLQAFSPHLKARVLWILSGSCETPPRFHPSV